LVEPLSQQELRVLPRLAAGLSNTEIAGELVVSKNTVKSQTQSIYRKSIYPGNPLLTNPLPIIKLP
jgi:LuxR family maltose regulon positive regulatory protein